MLQEGKKKLQQIKDTNYKSKKAITQKEAEGKDIQNKLELLEVEKNKQIESKAKELDVLDIKIEEIKKALNKAIRSGGEIPENIHKSLKEIIAEMEQKFLKLKDINAERQQSIESNTKIIEGIDLKIEGAKEIKNTESIKLPEIAKNIESQTNLLTEKISELYELTRNGDAELQNLKDRQKNIKDNMEQTISTIENLGEKIMQAEIERDNVRNFIISKKREIDRLYEERTSTDDESAQAKLTQQIQSLEEDIEEILEQLTPRKALARSYAIRKSTDLAKDLKKQSTLLENNQNQQKTIFAELEQKKSALTEFIKTTRESLEKIKGEEKEIQETLEKQDQILKTLLDEKESVKEAIESDRQTISININNIQLFEYQYKFWKQMENTVENDSTQATTQPSETTVVDTKLTGEKAIDVDDTSQKAY